MIAFKSRSLQTRIALLTLAIFLLSIWSIALYGSAVLRDEMQREMGELQFSTTSFVAADIDEELRNRLQALEATAAAITPALLADHAALQSFLEARLAFQSLFNGGVFATDAGATAIADVPRSSGRVGVNYLDRESISTPLREGRAVIGKPAPGKQLKAPIFSIVVPIRDAQGKVGGTLVGTVNLGRPNFLDKISEGRYGRAGGYMLMAPQHNLFVTASDRTRVMQPLPSQGANGMHDRYMRGYEGFGVAVSSRGVPELSAAKRIPSAGWLLVSALPTDEAFAPIEAVQRRILLATLALSLLAGALAWLAATWMLRRQLAPMIHASRNLESMARAGQPPPLLPVVRQDEIGELIGCFNRLLQIVAQRERALGESEERYRTAFLTSPDAVTINRFGDGRYLEVNASFTRLVGWTPEEVVGRSLQDLHIWRDDRARRRLLDALGRDGHCTNLEADFVAKDGKVVSTLMSAHVVALNGERCVLAVARDISERKAAEEQIRKLSLAVEQSPESIVITDLDAAIEYVNPAFVAKTGYSAAEALGKNPRILNSGKTPPETFADMWRTLAAGHSWRGTLFNRRKDGSEYVEFAIITPIRQPDGRITHYVGVKEDITAKKEAEDRINHLALHDLLTDLPNRQLLQDRMRRALASCARSGRQCALLMIDLDNFKTLNDTLGHDVGDALLQQVARRIAECMRSGDTVARLGGDEFIVMLEDLSGSLLEAASQAETVSEKILAALDRDFRLGDYEYRTTASIGITLLADRASTIEDMLKRADLAMYQAKAAGRATYRFFDAQMQAAVSHRAALEDSLREALRNEEFLLYYQAQVDAAGAVIGAEALVRWQSPQRGLVGPAEFIPLAEETGLILPLGQWVLEAACRQLVRWARQPGCEHFTIAVNVSARQFGQRDFVERVLSALARTGADPRRLKLELTEGMFVDDMEDVIAKMGALKARGVSFALDDFGTGYSCLAYLKRLPLDQLKIDRSFVRDVLVDPNDSAIARMVIALADNLGLAVIAEGVETEAHRAFLSSQGCHTYQGFLFSRPLPPDEFERLVGRK